MQEYLYDIVKDSKLLLRKVITFATNRNCIFLHCQLKNSSVKLSAKLFCIFPNLLIMYRNFFLIESLWRLQHLRRHKRKIFWQKFDFRMRWRRSFQIAYYTTPETSWRHRIIYITDDKLATLAQRHNQWILFFIK